MRHRRASILPGALFALFAMAVTGASQADGDPAAGREKAQICAQCHGEDGNAPVPQTPQAPHLAGQYADYMVKALEDYASGARKNPIMAGFAAGLSAQDRKDIAAWYASQKGLSTIHYLK